MSIPIETLLPGFEAHTPEGRCYVIHQRYSAGYQHGSFPLRRWQDAPLAAAALMQKEPVWQGLNPQDCLFLDIETTGLEGVDTLAFMVGVGFFEGETFELRQYFLRQPEEETALLSALTDLLENFAGLVTFNGRGFDVPLLHGRYRINGMPLNLKAMPNFDLLLAARKLWRHLPSRRLGDLETGILGVQRSSEDVAGSLIPRLYYDYLNSGDAHPMQQVAYHNALDVLSMVTLGGMLLHRFHAPQDADLLPEEALSLAGWYQKLGMMSEAITAFTLLLESPQHQISACTALGEIHKKRGEFQQMEQLWQRWAALAPTDPQPHLLLAKHYENTCRNPQQALYWAELALQAMEQLPPSTSKGLKLTALQGRIKRLAKYR